MRTVVERKEFTEEQYGFINDPLLNKLFGDVLVESPEIALISFGVFQVTKFISQELTLNDGSFAYKVAQRLPTDSTSAVKVVTNTIYDRYPDPTAMLDRIFQHVRNAIGLQYDVGERLFLPEKHDMGRQSLSANIVPPGERYIWIGENTLSLPNEVQNVSYYKLNNLKWYPPKNGGY